MSTGASRAKSKPRRAKTAAAGARPEPGPSVSHETLLDAIFADLPDPPAVTGTSVPDVVRAKRRDRARQRLLDALDLRGPFPLPEARVVELRRLAERWARKSFDAAFPEADELEIRCAEERAELEAEKRGDSAERFAAAERRYRREVERRHGWIELRGLQLSARVFQDLEIAYVPLHVEDASEAPPPPKPRKTKAKNTAKEEADIEAMLAMVRSLDRPRVPATRALTKHRRLFLVGGPGSGKSTLISWLAARSARGELDSEAGWLTDVVPFVAPVRSLREATIEALASAANAETWFLEAALREGRALLLVDGLDETKPEQAEALVEMLSRISTEHQETRVLLTSRPASTTGEDEPMPPGFACVRLTSMTVPEVHDFIDKWCLAAELSLGKAREHAEKDAHAAAGDLKERVRLRSAIEKLAQTPLLCSVICIVHRFQGQQIPERRVVLYEAITNALLYEWDRSKFPGRKTVIGELDAQQKRSLLSKLARAMHEAGAVEWPEAAVVESFAALLPGVGHDPEEAAAIIADIRDRSGVLVERRPGVFGFSHLTFQEYLAAMALVNVGAYERLLADYQVKSWHEVIVLAAGFPSADAERIVRGLLNKDGIAVAEGTMLAAQCMETAVELPASLRSDIETRVARIVPPKNAQEIDDLRKIGEIAGPILLWGLRTADAEGQAAILKTLCLIPYEPAVPHARRFMRTQTPVSRSFSIQAPMALVAAIALSQLAIHYDSALMALFEESAAHNPIIDSDEFDVLKEHTARGRAKIMRPSGLAPGPRRGTHSG